MTTAVTRADVREALRLSQCPVPDFTTREKATLVWSKVYIAIDGNKLRFVELNFLERIIRYLAGCAFYTDTIFADKETLEKVKAFVHGIQTAPAYHDPIAMDLFPKVRTSSDYTCLQHMLGNCRDIADADNNHEAIEDLAGLQQQVEGLSNDFEQNVFSEDFLSAAIALARQKLTKNPEDKMWMNITKVLNTTLGWNAGINTNLLNEILGFPDDSDLPSQRIEVPDEIKDAFGEGIAKTSGGLRLVSSNLTLRDHLEVLGELEKIDQCLDNLPEVLRPFLTQESGKQMVHDLSVRLIDNGAHVSIVRAYLGDEQQITNRLYDHADLDSIIFQHTELSRQVKSRMDSQRAAVMKNINSSYGVTELLPQIDSFSDSCDSFQDSGRMSWRELIFGELSTDPDFQKLIKARIKEDTKLQGFTLERYSEWIREPLSPIGLPELTVLSKITGRPVLIVRLGMGNFEWIDGINLDFAKEPIILNVNEEEMWAPVERI